MNPNHPQRAKPATLVFFIALLVTAVSARASSTTPLKTLRTQLVTQRDGAVFLRLVFPAQPPSTLVTPLPRPAADQALDVITSLIEARPMTALGAQLQDVATSARSHGNVMSWDAMTDPGLALSWLTYTQQPDAQAVPEATHQCPSRRPAGAGVWLRRPAPASPYALDQARRSRL